ncbi:hypothetical protein ACEPAF_1338 [Sanghuangporus sanghuang]
MFLFVAPAVGLYCIFNYQVWGKLMAEFATGRGKYSLVRHDLAIRALKLADIVSFTARGGGVGLRATIDHQDTGRIIFLGGVIFSNITYGLFVFLVVYSHLPNGIPAHGAHSNDGKLVTEESTYLSSLQCTSLDLHIATHALSSPFFRMVVHVRRYRNVYRQPCLCGPLPGNFLIQKAQDAADYSEIGMAAPRSESRDRLYP